MNKTKLTLGLVLIGLVILFTLQNTQVVEVRLLFWKLSMSQVLLIFLLLASGALLGWLACGASRHRSRR
jgi:putative membrane protein